MSSTPTICISQVTALSRVKSLDDVQIIGLHSNNIVADQRVVLFCKLIEAASADAGDCAGAGDGAGAAGDGPEPLAAGPSAGADAGAV